MGKKLEIQLLGGVFVRYGEKEIGLGIANTKTGKMWTLFKYIVLNSGRIVLQEELIDRLWPEMEVANPANSLKVLVFKLRRELDSLGGVPGSEVILTAGGGYCFNTEIPYVLDIDTFDRYLEMAGKAVDRDEKIRMLHSAVECYKGNVYVEARRGSWAIPIQAHYCELYEKAVRALADMLMEKGEYETVIDVCKRALLIQPYSEEFYYYIIRSYTLMKNYGAAAEMYREAQRVMNNEFGTRPDARFESAYREIMKQKPKSNLTVEDIQRELKEENVCTTLFVEYGEFRQIYRLIARRQNRISKKSYIFTYSLGVQRGRSVSKEIRKKHVQILGDALAFGLRRSDVFCRTGATQYTVLVEDISEEDAEKIPKRIREYFDRNKEKREISLVYRAAVIEQSYFEEKDKIKEKMEDKITQK